MMKLKKKINIKTELVRVDVDIKYVANNLSRTAAKSDSEDLTERIFKAVLERYPLKSIKIK